MHCSFSLPLKSKLIYVYYTGDPERQHNAIGERQIIIIMLLEDPERQKSDLERSYDTVLTAAVPLVPSK